MLEFKHYTKIYGNDMRAVDDLCLKVEFGVICGFIGANGAGKTTSLKAAAGIIEPTEGDVLIGGVSILNDPVACKSMTAYVPDDPTAYDFLTGRQYINFIADVFRVGKSERRERTERYAGLFGIAEKLDALVSSYSHGMKQKLVLTAALIHEPKLLLLDEPFVGLDPRATHDLKVLFRRLCDEKGAAIFFSTHVLDVAERLCDKIAIIKDGRLIAYGDTEAVKGETSLESVFLELTE